MQRYPNFPLMLFTFMALHSNLHSQTDHMPNAWIDKLSDKIKQGIEARFKVPQSQWYAWRVSDWYKGDTHQVVKFCYSQTAPYIFVRIPNATRGSSAILEYGEKDYDEQLAESLSDCASFRKLVDSIQGTSEDNESRKTVNDFALLVTYTRLGVDNYFLEESDRDKKQLFEECTDGSLDQRRELLSLCHDAVIQGSRTNWQLINNAILWDGSVVKVIAVGTDYQLTKIKIIELFSKGHFHWNRFDTLTGKSFSDVFWIKDMIDNLEDKDKSHARHEAADFFASFVIRGRFGTGNHLLGRSDRENKLLFERCTDGSAIKHKELLSLCEDAVMRGNRKHWELVFYTILWEGRAMKVVVAGTEYRVTKVKSIELFPRGHFRWH